MAGPRPRRARARRPRILRTVPFDKVGFAHTSLGRTGSSCTVFLAYLGNATALAVASTASMRLAAAYANATCASQGANVHGQVLFAKGCYTAVLSCGHLAALSGGRLCIVLQLPLAHARPAATVSQARLQLARLTPDGLCVAPMLAPLLLLQLQSCRVRGTLSLSPVRRR